MTRTSAAAASILDLILASKRHELHRSQQRLPAAALASLLAQAAAPRGFAAALGHAPGPKIIAEVKRASPSKGVLRPGDRAGTWRPEGLAQAYEEGGAAALSVLTDVHFFWGHPDAVLACSQATRLPVLRKEFIVDPYQVDESRWLGADAILLIVRALEVSMLHACAARALDLGMDVLVEVHDAAELSAALQLSDRVLLGVNHRNLDTFAMDMDLAVRLRDQVPAHRCIVAESGLDDPQQLARLRRAGIDAFLIGEQLARQDDPTGELRRLRQR